jgi:non-heme chloroperoxidase
MLRLISALLVLSALPAGQALAEYVEVSDALTVHYEQSGNGDTVVLLVPGWTMTTEVFSKQLAYFEGSGDYRFITYDPRGQGLSTKTAGGHFYEQHGRDLHAFIEALGLDNTVLGGWSNGGLDALAYLDQFGAGKLRGFIMLDAAPKSTGADNSKEWVWYRYDDADGFEEFFTMGVLRDRAATNVAFAEWMLEDASKENIDWVVDITNSTPDTVAALLNATGAWLDYSADLKGLEGELPLLYVVREEWGAIVSDWAAQHTPSARVEAFGKHLMFWERPEQFNAILADYLRSLK